MSMFPFQIVGNVTLKNLRCSWKLIVSMMQWIDHWRIVPMGQKVDLLENKSIGLERQENVDVAFQALVDEGLYQTKGELSCRLRRTRKATSQLVKSSEMCKVPGNWVPC